MGDGAVLTAYFGGMFDPPHRGHAAVVRTVLQQPGVCRLVVLVAAAPAHRQAAVASFARRLGWMRTTFRGVGGVEVSSLEERLARERPDQPTYTFDVLTACGVRDDGRSALVIGADQLANFDTWHRWRDLLDLVSLLVVPRPGHAHERPPFMPDSARLHLLAMDPVAMSSSALREMIARGDSAGARRWLPLEIADEVLEAPEYAPGKRMR